MSARLEDLITSQYVNTNGIKLHCVTAGRGEAVVVLLHGFPEHWYSWRHQIVGLAPHARVLAPDQRGYNLSDKPAGQRNYDVDILAADIVGLIESVGAREAYVVGHDWGGAIAWWLAIHYQHVVKKLVILNAPHPFAFQQVIRNFDQLRRSWYMFFFQLPCLPEMYVRGGNARAHMERVFRGTAARPDAFSDEDLDRLTAAIEQPGALTAMINYYRAALPRSLRTRTGPIVQSPTLVVWGEQDQFLIHKNTEVLAPWVKHLTIKHVPTAERGGAIAEQFRNGKA